MRNTSKYKGRQATIIATPEIEEKLIDLKLALPSKLAESTKQEYYRAAIQLLSATRQDPLQINSKGKWVQCKTVANLLKRKGIVPEDYEFYGLPVSWNVHEDKKAEILEEKYLDREQFRDFLNRLPEDEERGQQLRRACRFAYHCGLRRGEVLGLHQSFFKQRKKKWLIQLPQELTKGKKARKVPVPKDQLELILSFKSFSITANYIVYEVHKVAKALGKERKWTFHALRHSFGTNYIKAGGDVRTLQKIMGHERVETTTIYEHADIEDIPQVWEIYGY